MNIKPSDQISVLAAATGLFLLAIYFGSLVFGIESAERLPEIIACIAGFELYMFGQAQWERRKRRRGNDNG